MALVTFGGGLRSPEVVELIGHAGYDGVFIDMEHMAHDLRDIQVMVLAAERMDITPIVRTPGLDSALVLRLLDMGVQGIHVPHVSTAAAARALVDAARYTPQGGRGLIGYSRSADYGRIPLGEHTARSNREVLLAVMIEDLQGVDGDRGHRRRPRHRSHRARSERLGRSAGRAGTARPSQARGGDGPGSSPR